MHTFESRSRHTLSSDSATQPEEQKPQIAARHKHLNSLVGSTGDWPVGQIHSFDFPSVYIFQVFLVNSRTIWRCHRNESQKLFAVALFLNESRWSLFRSGLWVASVFPGPASNLQLYTCLKGVEKRYRCKAPHSGILAWRISRTEEHDGAIVHRVVKRHDLVTKPTTTTDSVRGPVEWLLIQFCVWFSFDYLG